jgi:hypothetical protein
MVACTLRPEPVRLDEDPFIKGLRIGLLGYSATGFLMLTEHFPTSEEAGVLARRALARGLAGDVAETTIATAQLVVTELIGGVLRCEPRPSSPIRLTAERHDSTLRVTVQDEGPERGSSFDCPDDRTPNGMAGRLLRGLSEAWGFERVNEATIAWSEFPAAAA